MFRQSGTQFARLCILAVLLVWLPSAGTTDASVAVEANQAPIPPGAEVAATLPCNQLTPFKANNFTNSATIDNQFFPLVPGMQFTYEGHVNQGGQPLEHQVIFTVTDLTKVINGVRTVVLWDRDFSQGVLAEAELAFHAQDNAKNIWNLGEYPEVYSGGQFTGAPDTWFAGIANALPGTIIPGSPQVGSPIFLQGYSPNIGFLDCGQVAAVGQHACVLGTCYDNLLMIDETSPLDGPATQQKYYAPNIGTVLIGAVNDPAAEIMTLIGAVQLGPAGCAAARAEALKLEQHAYQVSKNIYGKTPPAQQTGACPDAPTPTATPTASPTPPVSPTPSATPTTTPGSAPNPHLYLPITEKHLPPAAPFNGCKDDPDPASAPNYPVRIVKVNKTSEVVTLQNLSGAFVSVEDWNMCSLNGNQEHDQIGGVLAPGQTRDFPNTGGGPIWADSQRDDAALYDATGALVSYWIDQ
ncbi:MAG: hypothetical protein U0Z44_05060 [Kouleothrix sp.]